MRSIMHKTLLGFFFVAHQCGSFYEIFLSKMNALFLMVLWLFQSAGSPLKYFNSSIINV